jgi:putative flippase GtrA
VRYVSIQLAGLGLNAVLLIALVEVVGIGPIVAQAVAIGCVSLLNFGMSRRWVFGTHQHA